MKNQMIVLTALLAALTAQAAVINFTDSTEYPAGTDVADHEHWVLAGPASAYAGISSTANGVVIGSATASQWDSVKYTGKTFNIEIGGKISSSITFTFQQTGNNGWERLLGTGVRTGGSVQKDLNGYLTRNGNGTGDGSNALYSIGISQTDESSSFTAADLGLKTGETSDTLKLTVEHTRKGADLWDTQITLTNLNSTFSATYNKTDLYFGGGDINTLNGAIYVGREDGNINVSNRTISEFKVTPEPAR